MLREHGRRRASRKEILHIVHCEIEFVLAEGDQLRELGHEVVDLGLIALHQYLISLSGNFQAGIISAELIQDAVPGSKYADRIRSVQCDGFLHSIPVTFFTLCSVVIMLS